MIIDYDHLLILVLVIKGISDSWNKFPTMTSEDICSNVLPEIFQIKPHLTNKKNHDNIP